MADRRDNRSFARAVGKARGRDAAVAVFTALVAATAAEAVHASREATAGADLAAWLSAGYSVLKLTVVVALVFFVAGREPARRRCREPVAFAACFAAIAAVVALKRPTDSATTSLLISGEAVVLVSLVWMLAAVLTLGKCFGVLPEARGLVMHGPYRLVRHPIYLGELGMCAGLVIASPSSWNLVVAAAFAAAQMVRMRLEEQALRKEFPEYADYAARTARLIPRLDVRRGAGAAGSRAVAEATVGLAKEH
jgi:protein-S-isoprenylcysteine O-methyltransferase Ste14